MRQRLIYNFSQQITVGRSIEVNEQHNYHQQAEKLKYYKSLRIYKDYTFMAILNNLLINQAVKSDFLVDNSMRLYQMTRMCLGNRIASLLIRNTIGKVFTGGQDLHELGKVITRSNMNYIIDYCSEALEDLGDPEKFYDENSETFRQTILMTAQQNMAAIKVSGLCSIELLKKISQAQIQIQRFVEKDMTVSEILKKLSEGGVNLNQDQVQSFVTNILKVQSIDHVITPTHWRFRVHSCYIDDPPQPSHPILKYFNKFDAKEEKEFEKLSKRILNFMKPAGEKQVLVAFDAEQTYLQPAIDSFCEQMETKYNTEEKIIVVNTIQNYLKGAKDRIEYEIQKAQTFKRPIGLKMVRGAYIVEETKLSNKFGYENPICSSYQETSQMYDGNIQRLLSLQMSIPMRIVVASHNENTVDLVRQFMEQQNIPKNSDQISFAQLYGLSNHLTYSLQAEGYFVYKYIPFGETHIMIPYLIRRAQESRKMLQSTKLQSSLMIDELGRRLHIL